MDNQGGVRTNLLTKDPNKQAALGTACLRVCIVLKSTVLRQKRLL